MPLQNSRQNYAYAGSWIYRSVSIAIRLSEVAEKALALKNWRRRYLENKNISSVNGLLISAESIWAIPFYSFALVFMHIDMAYQKTIIWF